MKKTNAGTQELTRMSGHTRDSFSLDRRYDRILLLILLLISTPVAGALVLSSHAPKIFNSPQAWELTTQFFLAIVIGGAVALAYRHWEARRGDEKKNLDQEHERRAVQRATLQQFYRSAVALHHDYKKIRRTLRSLTAHDAKGKFIERWAFEELMNKLEDCQLRAESMKLEVRIQKDLFDGEGETLYSSMEMIEKYLRELLRAYEDEYDNRREIAPKDLMQIGQALMDFIERTKRSERISSELFNPAQVVLESTLKLIERTLPAQADINREN